MAKPQVHVDLTWTGDLTFRAETHGGRHLVTDGNSHAGFSPVELLAASAAMCMAVAWFTFSPDPVLVRPLCACRAREIAPNRIRIGCSG
jgi:hypothetical protein